MNEKTFTRVVLVTGKDIQGNEYAYSFVRDSKWLNQKNWFSIYSECELGETYIKEEVIPKVVKVRFAGIMFTRLQWVAMGCPFELSDSEMERIKLPNENHTLASTR